MNENSLVCTTADAQLPCGGGMPAVFERLENRVQLELLGDRAPPKLHEPDNFITFVSSLLVRTKHRTNAHVTIGNNPDAVTIASVRYHFMNAQEQARVDRDSEKVFTIENDILSPRQQIRLHFRCLVRGHKFGKLGWHLKGIRRALFLSDFADRNVQVPLDWNTPSRFVRQLSGIY